MCAVWRVSLLLSVGLLLSACGAAEDGEARGSQDAVGVTSDGVSAADDGAGAEADSAGATNGAGGDAVSEGDAAEGDAADDAVGSGGVCPPVGPFGGAVGEVAPPLTWLDCEGNAYDVRALCESEAVWMVLFAGWCPKCRAFAGQANGFAAEFESAHPDDFAGFFLVTETADYQAPDAAYCAEVRAQYGLEMPVLYEPTGETQRALGVRNNDVHIVLGRGNVVAFTAQYTTPDHVAAAIRALLQP